MHYHWKKKKRSKNGVVLNGTICLLLPMDVRRTGEEEAFGPLLFSSPSLSQNPKTNPTKTPICLNHDPWPTIRRKCRGNKLCGRLPRGRPATPYPCAMTG